MKIIFIRHGKTVGNLDKQYIGRTDEPLCKEGISELAEHNYPDVELVISSPLKRCIQTADIIYPQFEYSVYDDLRECNFGDFEQKNYFQLCSNPEYQKWLESGGNIPFPNGESKEDFSFRCCRAFEKAVLDNLEYDSIAFVVHGGTIMSVLEKFAEPVCSYYDYQVRNGCGYITECDTDTLKIKIISEIK